ncbi:hypothetical protein AYL99_08936 [Fonsecaea erecta]|uniref:Uncharacterized protein n=1 Tax=Fonsecaea erecta TaxID=1367422 RepID=A0A178ZAL7_9EURO|nr:hypothetical protein AYL99_08936 [Fonsecaea erecta]OAP56824.1 hypothetical protein AYL99_08936 [Fonsecaea erecta]
MDAPRLEIDQNGRARAVLQRSPSKKLCVRKPLAPELVIDDTGYARVGSPNKQLRLSDGLAVHLRVGLHSESYERTRPPAEDLDISVKEDGPSSANTRPNDDSLVYAPATPQNGRMAAVPAPPRYLGSGVEEAETFEQPTADGYREQREMQIAPLPILPSVVWIKKADAYTRLRHTVDIVTVNGEKYVRTDETHFLYAVNTDWPQGDKNVTIRRAPYRHWQAGRRDGRPEILFKLYPLGEWAYTPTNNRRKKAPQEFRPELDHHGRVLLNAFDRPLKFSTIMPQQVSTEIEGWEMEAICRLDPDICHQDFIDRMPAEPDNGKARPSKGTLNHRRRRDRMRMRVLPWPLPQQLSYSDQQVVNGVTQWEKKNNTTRGLMDLSREEVEMQEAIMYGGHFERSGANAQNDRTRLNQFWINLTLVRTKFTEDTEEVSLIKNRIAVQMEKMGLKYDHRIWDTQVGA